MRLEVKGIECVPSSGPTLLVSNHLGHTDPLAIALRLRRELRLVGKVQIFSWFFVGWAARMVDAIPLKRGESDREAMRKVLSLLSRGECVLVFPEGTYSHAPDPAALLPLQAGPAWLALRSGAQVVPVALTGTEVVWHRARGWRPWRRPRVTVTFGEPFTPALGTPVSRAALDTLTTQMAQRIAALLPPAYRGYYEHLVAIPS
jgi:1-acyl-sn-glycerol-3-phosphate acyltransferase